MARVRKIPAPSRVNYSKRRGPSALIPVKKEDAPSITIAAKASPFVLKNDDGPLTLGNLSPRMKRVRL